MPRNARRAAAPPDIRAALYVWALCIVFIVIIFVGPTRREDLEAPMLQKGVAAVAAAAMGSGKYDCHPLPSSVVRLLRSLRTQDLSSKALTGPIGKFLSPSRHRPDAP